MEKHFEIVGFIPESIAKNIGRESGFIGLTEKGIKHINDRHSKELKLLGMDAIVFCRFIADNYNEIRKGTYNEIFIIVGSEKTSNSAVIRLKELENGKYYYIETACPMKRSYLKKKELLWIRRTN